MWEGISLTEEPQYSIQLLNGVVVAAVTVRTEAIVATYLILDVKITKYPISTSCVYPSAP